MRFFDRALVYRERVSVAHVGMIAKNGGAALSVEREGASGAATMQAGMRGAVLARASGCAACLLQASARSPRPGTRPMHRLAAVTQQLARAMRWPLFLYVRAGESARCS